jgi:hypothetical protein
MKKYTHAWLAFMAVRRLQAANIPDADRAYAEDLVEWFKGHRDDVVQGAWYPDAVFGDMSTSHVLKITPSEISTNKFKKLPETYMSFKNGEKSPLFKKSFDVDPSDNLPDRCESISHSVVDNLKVQKREQKGSPVVPTSNHLALLLFMLSHYVADAHMPLHCDKRNFSVNGDVHGEIEGEWEKMVKRFYICDLKRERFQYDPEGYPLLDAKREKEFLSSPLASVVGEVSGRQFDVSYGGTNKNVWDFMSAVCQYSYLLSYELFPENVNPATVTPDNWEKKGTVIFDDVTIGVLSDAIDSIARVWFHVWRRYVIWAKKQK